MLKRLLRRLDQTGISDVASLCRELSVDVGTLKGFLRHLTELGYLKREPVHPETSCSERSTLSWLACGRCRSCPAKKSHRDGTDCAVWYKVRRFTGTSGALGGI